MTLECLVITIADIGFDPELKYLDQASNFQTFDITTMMMYYRCCEREEDGSKTTTGGCLLNNNNTPPTTAAPPQWLATAVPL